MHRKGGQRCKAMPSPLSTVKLSTRLPSRSHPALQCPLTAAPAPHCPIHCSVLSGLRLTRCPHAQQIHFALARQWHRLLTRIIEDLKSRSVDQQVGRRTLSICNSPHKIGQNFTQKEEHSAQGRGKMNSEK